MGREVELKLELDPDQARRLKGHRALAKVRPTEQDQLSVYFDTRRLKLRKAGYTLRVRQTGQGFVQTIKAISASAGMFDRAEWEMPVERLEPDLDAAAGTPLRAVISPRGARRLQPVVRCEVRRTTWPLRRDGAEIEMIFDEGTVRAGEAEAALSEIELELVDGEVETLVELANQLAAKLPVRIGVLTKAERGFALADGTLAKVSKAPPLDLAPDVAAAEGFTAICLSCLKHFRLNEPLIVSGRLAGALHKARVAMRRLRSALSLFRPMLRGDPRFAPLREELRWFTNQLGEARNLDVFLGRFDDEDGSREELSRAREASYDSIVETLGSKRFRELMLGLVAWLATGEWRDGKRSKKPLLAFTNKRIDALWHDIAARGEDLARLEEEPRHRLRIDIKKIRYALEFVRGLHPGKATEQKRFGSALEGLQESLGALNDIATAREIAARHLTADRASEPLHGEEEQATHLREAQRHFRRLKKVGAYWRQPA